MLNRIRKMVETKLACIDIENKHSKGEEGVLKYHHEIAGIKQALYEMGIELKISINPYHWENGEPSTCEININQPA